MTKLVSAKYKWIWMAFLLMLIHNLNFEVNAERGRIKGMMSFVFMKRKEKKKKKPLYSYII